MKTLLLVFSSLLVFIAFLQSWACGEEGYTGSACLIGLACWLLLVSEHV